MEDLPSRQIPFPVSTRRHFVPAFSFPGFPLTGSGVRAVVCRNLSQPCPSPVRHRPTPPHAKSATRIHARAAHGAKQSRKPLFGEPGGLRTRAPNLQRLRQAGDARQDLVRISESTTKCGDCGEESGGDEEVSKIRGESERPLHALSPFCARAALNRAARTLGPGHGCECGSVTEPTDHRRELRFRHVTTGFSRRF